MNHNADAEDREGRDAAVERSQTSLLAVVKRGHRRIDSGKHYSSHHPIKKERHEEERSGKRDRGCSLQRSQLDSRYDENGNRAEKQPFGVERAEEDRIDGDEKGGGACDRDSDDI